MAPNKIGRLHTQFHEFSQGDGIVRCSRHTMVRTARLLSARREETPQVDVDVDVDGRSPSYGGHDSRIIRLTLTLQLRLDCGQVPSDKTGGVCSNHPPHANATPYPNPLFIAIHEPLLMDRTSPGGTSSTLPCSQPIGGLSRLLKRGYQSHMTRQT